MADPEEVWIRGARQPRPPERDPALLEGLKATVPLWVRHYRQFCHITAQRRARQCGIHVGTYGDVLQFRTKRTGRAAECFNRLAEGVAIAASQPGGVTVFGLHFAAPPLPEPAAGCTIQWCARGGLCCSATTRPGSGLARLPMIADWSGFERIAELLAEVDSRPTPAGS